MFWITTASWNSPQTADTAADLLWFGFLAPMHSSIQQIHHSNTLTGRSTALSLFLLHLGRSPSCSALSQAFPFKCLFLLSVAYWYCSCFLWLGSSFKLPECSCSSWEWHSWHCHLVVGKKFCNQSHCLVLHIPFFTGWVHDGWWVVLND